MELLDRFLKYVSIDTTSFPTKLDTPTTKGQLELAKIIIQELNELNVDKLYFDEEHCYVYAKIKGNDEMPKLGFISHLDTSPDAKGNDIHTKIINDYDGGNVILSEGIILNSNDYEDLKNHIGKTLITTDGKTLLGADDKAGISEIMQMIEKLKNEKIEHGDIFICFTPDEELGMGTLHLDYSIFKPDFAYTIDGSSLGEISYENFNAATAKIKIKGNSTHTGTAKGKMINASRIAFTINNLLPNEIPENTEGYEGFFHLKKIKGDVANAELEYLIRDFDKKNFHNRKILLAKIVSELNQKLNNCIELNIKDTYYNMKDKIGANSSVVEQTKEAMKKVNVEPSIYPIRGGTDGAEITKRGIICPNIGTGGHNFHSVYEYAVLEDMEKTVEILVSIVKQFSNKKINKNYQKK